jgi:hypothetical protein
MLLTLGVCVRIVTFNEAEIETTKRALPSMMGKRSHCSMGSTGFTDLMSDPVGDRESYELLLGYPWLQTLEPFNIEWEFVWSM